MATLRLQFITVISAVLSSIAEVDLGDTLVLTDTTEQEVRTGLVWAPTDPGLVTAVRTVWPAVTNLTSNIKIRISEYQGSSGLTFSLRRQELSAHCH